MSGIMDQPVVSITGFDKYGIVVGCAERAVISGEWLARIVGKKAPAMWVKDEGQAREYLRQHGAVTFTERTAGHVR